MTDLFFRAFDYFLFSTEGLWVRRGTFVLFLGLFLWGLSSYIRSVEKAKQICAPVCAPYQLLYAELNNQCHCDKTVLVRPAPPKETP